MYFINKFLSQGKIFFTKEKFLKSDNFRFYTKNSLFKILTKSKNLNEFYNF